MSPTLQMASRLDTGVAHMNPTKLVENMFNLGADFTCCISDFEIFVFTRMIFILCILGLYGNMFLGEIINKNIVFRFTKSRFESIIETSKLNI